MKFSVFMALNNVKRKPFRSLATIALVMCLSFAVFAGAMTIISLQQGLLSYQARLGADIVVVPNNATAHGAVDDIFLQGITGNYYMSARDIQKIINTEGVDEASCQFFLTSAKASCCSSRVQIIGFDPATDFSIKPWINSHYSGKFNDGDIIVGANIDVPLSKTLTFYGTDYRVIAQLDQTGTGLDSAIYTNTNTIKQMASNAVTLLNTDAFEDVDISSAASAVLIKVKDGYAIEDVTDDINIHISKVQASSSRSMIANLMNGLGHMSRFIGILVAAIWLLSVAILVAVFVMLSNERKKEFAIMRIMGASQKILFKIMSLEALILSGIGGLIGVMIGVIVSVPLSGLVSNLLSLPFLMPNMTGILMIVLGSLLLSVIAALLPAMISAKRMTNSETGLLLREDA